jgi:hypothetical protein
MLVDPIAPVSLKLYNRTLDRSVVFKIDIIGSCVILKIVLSNARFVSRSIRVYTITPLHAVYSPAFHCGAPIILSMPSLMSYVLLAI